MPGLLLSFARHSHGTASYWPDLTRSQRTREVKVLLQRAEQARGQWRELKRENGLTVPHSHVIVNGLPRHWLADWAS